MIPFETPRKLSGSREKDISDMWSYLYQMAEKLNLDLGEIETAGVKLSITAGEKGPEHKGWVSLGLSDEVINTALDVGRAGPGCYYRVENGNHVYVSFGISYTYSGSTVIVQKEKIPEKYRPKRIVYSLCASNGKTVARALVTASGNIAVDWVQNMTTGEETTNRTATWLEGYIDYFID